MKGATVGDGSGMVRGVRYTLEAKAADWPDPAVPDDALGGDPNAPTWAGDLYEEGDQSDPVDAFAAFTGGEGQTAWLDRAADGTLTGWVQDGDSVYRYTDPQAWATDVDGASMSRAGELGGDESDPADPADEPVDGDAVEGEEPPADGEEPPAEGEDPAQQVELDDSTGHDPNGDTPAVPGDGVAPMNEGDPAEPEHDENMDPMDDNFYTRMKKKGEKKSLALHVRVVE